MNNTPKEFDQYRDTYEKEISESISFAGQGHDFFTKVKGQYLLEILENEVKNGEPLNVLDVGCGHGLIHPYLISQTKVPLKLTGVDVAESVVEFAREKNPKVQYQAYDGFKLPFADKTFSAAYAICVVHHVPPAQWGEFLKEIYRVVKPGGVVVIFEHNPLNPMTLRVVNTCELDKDAVLLPAGRLKKLFQGAGLKQVENSYILFTPIDQKFFSWIDRKLHWLPLGAQYYTLGRK